MNIQDSQIDTARKASTSETYLEVSFMPSTSIQTTWEEFERLLKTLDNPLKPNEMLRRAMARFRAGSC